MTDSTTTTALNELEGTYALDPAHSRMGFVARHAMVTKVRGNFNDFSGSATVSPGMENASVEVDIKVDSIDTRHADRDGHLRTGDFFNTEQFPHLTFRSTEVTTVDADTLRVTGDLTIKDVTRPVTFDLEYAGAAVDPYGNQRIGFEGSTKVKRSDFGMSFNAALETGGVLVSDDITLEFEISAIKS